MAIAPVSCVHVLPKSAKNAVAVFVRIVRSILTVIPRRIIMILPNVFDVLDHLFCNFILP